MQYVTHYWLGHLGPLSAPSILFVFKHPIAQRWLGKKERLTLSRLNDNCTRPVVSNMLWFIIVTQTCNLNCSYCGGGDFDPSGPHPRELSFDLELLETIARDDPSPIIAFYGGEPLLRISKMETAMDMVPNATFVVQTNGTLLHKLPDAVLHRFDTILVSIDGGREQTDRFRGSGTFDKIVENVQNVRARNYKGDLIARMTVTEPSDIARDVTALMDMNLFDHVHWQLDALWDEPMTARWHDFERWRDENYNPGISELARLFLASLQKGVVLPIVPFLGILTSMLDDKPSPIRCGAGLDAFAITTGGLISVCPIAPQFEGSFVGELSPQFSPLEVLNSMPIGGKCLDCEILDLCGGRCLYSNKTNWWGDNGFDAVCETVKHLIHELESIHPQVVEAVRNGIVAESDIRYPPFNNTCEIIP